MTTMNDIDLAAKEARAARLVLTDRATSLQAEIEAIKRRRVPGIKAAVAAVAEADAKLLRLLEAAPALFVRPRSIVLHGLKVGFKKGAGRLEFSNIDKVVELIEKHFPEAFDTLVKTRRTPIKKALQNLPAGDLKKLGITVTDTGDVCFIADATDNVDKLVAALLGEAQQGDDAEE